MLIRLVRMTIAPDRRTDFLALFDSVSPSIRSHIGCHHLELWQDVRYPNVLTTYSLWENEDALNAYRNSDVFIDSWQQARRMFAAEPETMSFSRCRSVAEPAQLA
ncbi:MAG: putative quinol monooxygenase [Rhodothermales bacterium]